MFARRSVFACVTMAMVCIAGSTGSLEAQEIRGFREVQAELQRVPPAGRVRIIAETVVDPALIPALGAKNAMNRSVENAVVKISQIGIPVVEPILGTPRIVMEVNSGELAQLQQLGVILSYEIDRLNEPFLGTLTPAIGGNTMHLNNARGLGTAVAIIDTGVDAQHPFFGSRVTGEACFSTNSAANGTFALCPNGATTQTGPGAAAPCVNLCDHGTHVAGIASGNNVSMRGLAPDSNIIAVNVFSRVTTAVGCNPSTAPCVKAFNSDIERALVHVRDVLLPSVSVSAINLSLGGGAFSQECTMDGIGARMQELRVRGVAIIVASGNNSCNFGSGATGCTNAISYPACLAPALSVGATNNAVVPNTVQMFSNSAAILDVLAPGNPVFSSVPGGYANNGGTSMAAPVVTGAIAALRSKFSVNVDAAENAIKETGVSVTDPRNGIAKPRISAQAAYNKLEADRPASAFIWMKDTWNDSGAEPDPGNAGQPMSGSPFIWVRNQDDGIQQQHNHQNPEFGQPNFIYTKVLNTGRTQGTGTLSLFITPATPNPNLGSNWIRLNDVSLTLPPRQEAVYKFPWLNVPAPGHYCLLAKWTDTGGDTNLNFTNLDTAIRNSNDLIWKNINIIDLLKNQNVAADFVLYKGKPGEEPNFAIDVTGSRTRNTMLTIKLPITLISKLKDEPTLSHIPIEIEGPYAKIKVPLNDGVYYFPLPENAMPENLPIPMTFDVIEKGDKTFDFHVDVRQFQNVFQHKKTGTGEVGAITYIVR
jgi:subtilisin family serine protease